MAAKASRPMRELPALVDIIILRAKLQALQDSVETEHTAAHMSYSNRTAERHTMKMCDLRDQFIRVDRRMRQAKDDAEMAVRVSVYPCLCVYASFSLPMRVSLSLMHTHTNLSLTRSFTYYHHNTTTTTGTQGEEGEVNG